MKYLLEFIIFVGQKIPLSAAMYTGKLFGRIGYLFTRKRVKIAYANLRASFPEKSPFEKFAIIKKTYENIGMNVVEMLRFPLIDNNYFNKYIEVEGKENIECALDKKQGLILLTGHFGNWELASVCLCMMGYPLLVLARDQKPKVLYKIVNRFRESKGCKVIRKGILVREIIKGLRENKAIGILADQDAGKKGEFVEFFGRLCSWHTGAFQISEKTGCSILPIFIIRERGPYHKLFILPEIERKTEADSLKKFVKVFEQFIRKNPQQWLWMHKRWKTKKTFKITLLTDEKAGHRNQCLEIIKQIKNISVPTKMAGLKNENISIHEIPVRYKKPFYKTLITIISLFYRQGQMGFLRHFLAQEAYSKIYSECSDIVISAGSSLAGINLILTKENLSKNIVIMKPSFLPFKNFTLSIVPQHDNPPKKSNIIITRTAISSIDEEILKASSLTLKDEICIDKDCIGLLIGGDTKNSKMSVDIIGKVCKGILDIAKEKGLYMLVTTSRRTSRDIEDVLIDIFKDVKGCKMLIIANRNNRKNIIPAILGTSKIIVVSGESMSMLSEAKSSARYVIAFLPERIALLKTKYEKAIEKLEKQRFLKISKPEDIYSTIKEAIEFNLEQRKIQDSIRIKEGLKKIL